MNTQATATAEKTRTWSIDPVHSQVEFGVRHMMISTVKGHFSGVDGQIRLNEEDFTASAVEVKIDASSIDTRNEDRDQHLRSDDFFNVEKHPHLRFVSRKVEGTPDDFTVNGDLTIRGETREVTLEGEELGRGTDPWDNPRVAFRAQTTINRKDFGLTWNQALEAGGVLVGDKVTISLEIQALAGDDENEG